MPTPSIVHAFALDVVLNADRTRMYISRDDGIVTVYDTFTGLVVDNFNVGAKLGGLDLSADGSYLLVVEKTTLVAPGDADFVIHKVDVATGAVTDFTKHFTSIEGPFHDVALFADGTAITTTTLRGSGATTTYRLDTHTGIFTTLASSSAQGPIVTASADRLSILLTNGYNVSGLNQMYDLATETVVQLAASRGVGSSGRSIHAFAPDGSLVAYLEHQTGVDVFDNRLNKLTTLAGIPGNDVGGLAFDDHGDHLYVLVISTREILKVATSDWSVVAHIPVDSDVGIPLGNGNFNFGATLAVGPDAKFFTFISTEDVFRIENPTALTPVEGTSAGETMTGTAGQDLLYGLDGDDIMNGGEGNDTLRGNDGNDELDGGAGHDAMYGGAGDDVYHVDDVRDRAAEADSSGGSDEVHASVSFALEGNIERLILTGAGAIDGTGNAIANIITGTEAANVLKGMGGDDVLTAGGGNDTLNGGTGTDDMQGGAGNDIYVVDSLADIVTELAGEGVDEIQTTISYSIAALDHVENLTGSGTAALTLTGNAGANVIRGGNGADIIVGGAGADTMTGGLGNDTYYVDDALDVVNETAAQGTDRVATSVSYALAAGASVERLEAVNSADTAAMDLTGSSSFNLIIGQAGVNFLRGEGANDQLIGLGGNDFLIGGIGADIMHGGTGDDTFYVDNAGDRAFELAGEGTDRIATSISYTLDDASEVELLESVNTLDTNAMDLTGSSSANTIIGNAGVNFLFGAGGNDTLVGLDGNDFLIGGTGADFMYGGAGDDTYYVDNLGDQAGEAAGEGTDRIATSISYALIAGSEIELLESVNSTDTIAMDLTGSDSANQIVGNDGVNILRGEGGNDTLIAYGGDDYLVGGTGNDTMFGGTGNDTYYVDNAGDVINETAGQGSDRVATSVSYTLAADADIETLEAVTQADTNAMDLTGNALNNTIVGNDGVNILDGKGGNDLLIGLGGADTFAYTSALGGGNVGRIANFASGTDKIALDDAVFTGLGLGALNANAFVIGNQALDADDRIIFNDITGQLRFDADGTGAGAAILFGVVIIGNVNAADFVVI